MATISFQSRADSRRAALIAALALAAGASGLVAGSGDAPETLTAGVRLPEPAPGPPPRDRDPALTALVATLQRTGRGDALVVGDRRITVLGSARGLRPSFYRPTALANVMLGQNGTRVALPVFGRTRAAGALVTATGVALREFARPRVAAPTITFVVPCALTSLARDQFAYVYLGSFSRSSGGVPRLTEIGMQMNPPPGGGTPRSVQLYARRVAAHGVVATDAGVHLRCDVPLRVTFGPLGPAAEFATFSGPAVPLRSQALTIVERLEPGERVGTYGEGALERVTALAVPEGSQALRRGSRLGAAAGDREPRLTFERDRDFVPAAGSPGALVVAVHEADRTRVAIDERASR